MGAGGGGGEGGGVGWVCLEFGISPLSRREKYEALDADGMREGSENEQHMHTAVCIICISSERRPSIAKSNNSND